MAPRRPRIYLPPVVRRASGLLLPRASTVARDAPSLLATPRPSAPANAVVLVGEPPSDLDGMMVAPDAEALNLPQLGFDDLQEVLREVPAEGACILLGGLAAAVWHIGFDRARHRELAEDLFDGRPVLANMLQFFAEDEQHLLFNEQHIYVLLRLVLQHGRDAGDAPLGDQGLDALLTSLVSVGGLIQGSGTPDDDTRLIDWVPWLTRMGAYFHRPNIGHEIARARALFSEIQDDTDREGPSWCDLQAWMEEDLAPLDDQVTYGYAMAASTRAFDENVQAKERLRAVLPLPDMLPGKAAEKLAKASSASVQEFRQMFAQDGDTVDHVIWDRAPFERRPFLRLHGGGVMLLSPRFLRSWMGEGIYYRLLDDAQRRRDPVRPDRKASKRFTEHHGVLIEEYVARAAQATHAVQQRAGVVRISREQRYTGRSGTEQKTPDLFLSYALDAVAIEVTGGRMTRRARVISDPAPMLEDLRRRVLEKLVELDDALMDILQGVADIPDLDRGVLRNVWPVVVVPSMVLQTDGLWAHLRADAPQISTRHAALRPPTLLSLEDFERLLSVVETGQGFSALLAMRAGSEYAQMPVSRFLAARFPRIEGRGTYLNGHLDLLNESVRQRWSTGE